MPRPTVGSHRQEDCTCLVLEKKSVQKSRGEHLPFESVLAFSPEVVHMGLEMQLEHIVFVDVLRL